MLRKGKNHNDCNKMKTKNCEGLVKSAKLVLFFSLSLLLICVAIFGGATLGNENLSNTIMQNGNTETLDVAEAGSSAGGSSSVAYTLTSLSTTTITIDMTSKFYYTWYWSGNSHGNQLWSGAGYYGNGGTGTVRQKVTISNASACFQFGGILDKLVEKNLLQVTVTATVRSKNGYDGDRAVGYALASGVKTVTQSSVMLDGYNKFVTRYTNGSDQTARSSTTALRPGSVEKYISIGVGGYCNYTKLVGGRYPGQVVENIVFSFTSLDKTAPAFDAFSYSTWSKNQRSVSQTVSDFVQIQSITATNNGTAFTPSIGGTDTSRSVSFTATASGRYQFRATDTSGNSALSKVYDYKDYKIDSFAPKILQVVYVQSNDKTKFVANGLTGNGNPYSGDVICYIQVEDYDSNSTHVDGNPIYNSGIKLVKYGGAECIQAVNEVIASPTGSGTITTTRTDTTDPVPAYRTVGKGWYKYTTAISSNTNSVEIVVIDNVDNGNTKNASLHYIDKIAPVVENAQIKLKDGTLITTANANTWFNQTATLTLSVIDYATSGNLPLTRDWAAGLSNLSIAFTKFIRSADKTKAEKESPVTTGNFFNPHTTGNTSGKNEDGTPYMTRKSYGAGTCNVSGITYYCYRYVIEVPILYRTDYSFIITDKAGNSTSQFKYAHTAGAMPSYKPLIDETAPTFGSVNVYGYLANNYSLGDATISHINADYLIFEISATDTEGFLMPGDGTYRWNDGSGVTKIEIYDTTNKLVSRWTGGPSPSVSKMKLFVYKTGFSGIRDGTAQNNTDINTCTNPRFRIVIYDTTGNRSDFTPSDSPGSMQINPNGTEPIEVNTYVDNVAPRLYVLKSSDNSLLPSNEEYYNGDSTTRIYEFNWTKDTKSVKLRAFYGCSGAKILMYTGDTESEYTSYPINSIYENEKLTVPIVFGTEGITYYRFEIVNGASVKSMGIGIAPYTIVLKVKVDRTAPTYEFLGFGTNMTITNKDIPGMKASIVSPLGTAALTEALLTTPNSYFGKGFKAFYYIKDTYGSVYDNPAQTSWLSSNPMTSTEGTVSSLAKAMVTSKHGNYSHTYEVNYDNTSNPNYTILIVDMYNLNILKNMKYNTTSFHYFENNIDRYNVTYGENVIYNISIYDAVGNINGIKNSAGSTTNLSYNVDPFPLNASFVESITEKSGDMIYDYVGGWTDLDVKYTLKKQTSITSVVCQYKLVPMTDVSGTPIKIGEPSDYEWIDVGDLGSATSAFFTLSTVEGSKCAFVYIRIYKNLCNFSQKFPEYQPPANEERLIGNLDEYIIRQDIDVPIITAVYFSRNPGLTDVSNPQTNNDFLAYFKANFDGNNYTYTRLTSNTNVWTFEKFYMYVIATDSRGTGSGAGVQTVTLWDQDNIARETSLVNGNINTTGQSYSGEKLFRSKEACFGYITASNTNPVSFRLADSSPKSNTTSVIAINTDTNTNRVLPRIDSVLPRVNMTKAIYGSYNTNYLSEGKLSGNAITQNLSITLNYSYGISGARIYCIKLNDYFGKGYSSTADDPWGYAPNYLGTIKSGADLAGLVSASYFESLTPIVTIAAGSSGTTNYTYVIQNIVETKARYYYFIVSNVNEYYEYSDTYQYQKPFGYLTAGDVFIDNTAPTIDNMIFVSAVTGNVMDINTVYTNDNIYAYYFVSDGASGVANVFHVNQGVEIPLQPITSGIYAGSYMLTMTDNIGYQIRAYDVAGNSVTGGIIIPKIDTINPTFTINTFLSDDKTEYNSTFVNNFTNSPYIYVHLRVNLGMSQLHSIMYRTGGGAYANILTMKDKDGNFVTVNKYKNYAEAIFAVSQNHSYEFTAYNNVPAEYSKTHTVPSVTQTVHIAIDITNPALNTSDSLFASIKNIWHNQPQEITLDASDNLGGSGIDTIRMSYKIDGISQDDVIFTYDEGSGRYVTADKFKLSHFVTYNIVITDKAGNVSQTYPIRPALDMTKPVFDIVSNGNAYTLKNVVDGTIRTDYTADTWTKYNVEINLNPSYSMSGAKVQYSTNNGASWADMASLIWDPSDIGLIPDEDAIRTVSSLLNPFTVSPTVFSVNTRYMFRIVSNSGIVSDILDAGIIKIDNEKPLFDNATTVSDKNPMGFTAIPLSSFEVEGETYTATLAHWTCEGVNIFMKTNSALASGVKLEYCYFNVAQSDWSVWTAYSTNAWNSTFTYDSNNPGVSYKFRYVSGSNMISKEFIVKSIKVDKQNPVFSLGGRTSYVGVTNPDGTYAPADANAFMKGGTYNFGIYTSAKYVIFRVIVSTMGYSGVTVSFRKTGDDAPVQYAALAYGDSGELYYYIPATANLTVYVKSIAGIERSNTASIKIDNALPELYISGISGKKSTNWDDTLENSWFTESVTITFGAGSYTTESGLKRSDKTPESGFAIQYKVSNDGGITFTNWQSVSSTTFHSISTSDVLTANIYRFRIQSNSGLINELGQNLVYNGSTVATAAAVKSNIATNHPNAKFNHLSDIDYNYVINLDKNDYIFTTTQIIQYQESGASEPVNSISASYAEYVYFIKINGSWVQTTDYTFKHGDQIKVAYNSNYGNNYNGDNGHYLHRHTEYRNTEMTGRYYQYNNGVKNDNVYFELKSNKKWADDKGRTGEYSLTGKNISIIHDAITIFSGTVSDGILESANAQYRKDDATLIYGQGIESDANSGSFEFQFATGDFIINSYYKKELDTQFENTVIYLQSFRNVADATFKSKALVYYLNTLLDVSISYKNMNTDQLLTKDELGYIKIKDVATGGYLLTVTFNEAINSESFILRKPCTVLLVKYFEIKGSEPFTVEDQYDIEKISSTYYDSFTGSGTNFTLGEAKTYLSNSFKQTKDITLSSFASIGEIFSGIFDGNNHKIVWNDNLVASGTFGLFKNLTGTVKNLALSVQNTIIVENAENVGVLTGNADGAIINNVWVSAEMCINSALENANIGGLAGRLHNSQVGRVSAVYADVRMKHDSTVISNVLNPYTSIGGIAGYVSGDTYVNNTYNFGGMEIYYVNVDNISIGAVVGKLDDYVTEYNKTSFFNNNRYLAGNVFVNDALSEKFAASYVGDAEITNSEKLSYRDFVTSDLSSSVGNTVIAAIKISDSVLKKLYKDFNINYDTGFKRGIGIKENMLEIGSMQDIEKIDKYAFLNYKITGDVDMADFHTSLCLHKVFSGIVEGKNVDDCILTNLSKNMINVSEKYLGLFANFNGTIQNIVFKDIDINVSYNDAYTLYAGLVAAKTYNNANINNIIAIGSVNINAHNSDVIAGGLVGLAERGHIYNVFNMANIKVVSKNLSLGGIAGDVTNTTLVNYTDEYGNEISDAIFSLARVEGIYSGFGSVGAIVGDGVLLEVLSDMSKVFALEDNTYANGSLINYIVGSSSANSTELTTFANTNMRGTSVSDGNLFTEVFVTRSLYPLGGVSEMASSTVGADADNPFKINNENDFKYINNALYAYYRIASDITFTNFRTIGEGLYFTGKIDGKTATSGSAEEGTVVALHNVTDSLLYYNKGTISDLSMEVVYERTLGNNADEIYGSIAKYNKGTIRSVIVSGEITLSGGSSITASGFVGVDEGGTIDNSSIKNSISSITLKVSNTGTAYVGGYVGVITGATTISFAIGQGAITIEECGSDYTGWLAGRVEGSLLIDLEKIQNYTYSIVKIHDGITTNVPTIEEGTGLPINYYGWSRE